MRIIRNFQNINNNFQNSVLSIGNFDGFHLGHLEILSNAKRIADSENLKSALLTFEPHPLKIIRPERNFDQRLFSLSKKLSFLQKNNLVDLAFLVGFNHKIREMKAEDFVKEILIDHLRIKHLVVGYDFIFGKNRSGDAKMLQELGRVYNFSFHQIAAKNDENSQIYSSSKIRKLLLNGDIKSANSMLGREYEIDGIVVSGKKLARQIGFATANFLPKKDLIKPKFGVYKVLAKINNAVDNKEYKAILNFGIKPTFNESQPLFEVHIFGFNEEIYGKKISVKLLDFIREERKFNGVEELKEQIKKDILQCD